MKFLCALNKLCILTYSHNLFNYYSDVVVEIIICYHHLTFAHDPDITHRSGIRETTGKHGCDGFFLTALGIETSNLPFRELSHSTTMDQAIHQERHLKGLGPLPPPPPKEKTKEKKKENKENRENKRKKRKKKKKKERRELYLRRTNISVTLFCPINNLLSAFTLWNCC